VSLPCKFITMALPLSPNIHKLEREIAALSFEEKLWLLAQIAQQVQPSLAAQLPVENLPGELFSEMGADLRTVADAPNLQREGVEISESAPLLEGQLLRKNGVLVLGGTLEGDVDGILDEVREERIQEIMGQ
jgi:hypothetical protein